MVSAVPYEHNSVITRRGWKGLLLLLAVVTLLLFQGRALFAWVALYVTYGLIRSLLRTFRDIEQRKTI